MLFSLFINRRIQERWTLRSCKVWWLPPSPIVWKKKEIAVGNGVWVVDSSDQGSLHVGPERNLTQYQPHVVGGGGGGGTAVLHTYRLMGMCSWMGLHIHNWGLFLKRPSWLISQFLAHKPVNFALLVDSFIVSFSKFLKLWFSMQT